MENKNEKSITKTIRISPSLSTAINEIAEKERRTPNNMITIILEDFVSEYNKKHPTE